MGARSLAILAAIILALGLYAYYAVFFAKNAVTSAVIFLYKPFCGLALVAAGILAGFIVSRAKARNA